jgi:hypothetical protein
MLQLNRLEGSMRTTVHVAIAFLTLGSAQARAQEICAWSQWGQSATHDGDICRPAQPDRRELAHVVFDPFVAQEQEDRFGLLFVHYQAALNDDLDNVYMMQKQGSFTPCDPPGSFEPFPCGMFAPESQVWAENGYHWNHGKLEQRWSFASDWKPLWQPAFFEPMFQPALWGPFIYVPGAGGTVWQIFAPLGIPIRRINPFGNSVDPTLFVTGGVTTDRLGNVYWNVVRYDTEAFFASEGWLVKVNLFGGTKKVSYTGLVPGAPADIDPCFYTFSSITNPILPPPPAPDGTPALPPVFQCGVQRPSLNFTVAIGADGTIFTGSRADFDPNYSYLIALKPDLSLKWATSLRGLVNDGCGALVPSSPTRCPPGTAAGVDPFTNLPPALTLNDDSSSTPVALPDGGVAYGALDDYNGGRGHLVKLGRDGSFRGTYTFGWDITPAVYRHDGTYSLILKDNDYANRIFNVTQLSSDLHIEWQYLNQTIDDEHPTGFEWCINAPAVDSNGTVYLTSEDGNEYAIQQGGQDVTTHFLDINDGAAYTPISLDARGRIYTLANGVLTVLGR